MTTNLKHLNTNPVFTGDYNKLVEKKLSILNGFIDAAKVNAELTLQQYFKTQGINRNDFIANAPKILADLKPTDGFGAVNTAVNLMKKRLAHGRIHMLQDKLNLLNTYLGSEFDTTATEHYKDFGDFLAKSKVSENSYLKGLPPSLQVKSIFTEPLQALMNYGTLMHAYFAQQTADFVDTAPEGTSPEEITAQFKKPVSLPAAKTHSANAAPAMQLSKAPAPAPIGSQIGHLQPPSQLSHLQSPSSPVQPPPILQAQAPPAIQPIAYMPPVIQPVIQEPLQAVPAPVDNSGGFGGGDGGGGGDTGSGGTDTSSAPVATFPLNPGDSNGYVQKVQEALKINPTGTMDAHTIAALKGEGYNVPLNADEYKYLVIDVAKLSANGEYFNVGGWHPFRKAKQQLDDAIKQAENIGITKLSADGEYLFDYAPAYTPPQGYVDLGYSTHKLFAQSGGGGIFLAVLPWGIETIDVSKGETLQDLFLKVFNKTTPWLIKHGFSGSGNTQDLENKYFPHGVVEPSDPASAINNYIAFFEELLSSRRFLSRYKKTPGFAKFMNRITNLNGLKRDVKNVKNELKKINLADLIHILDRMDPLLVATRGVICFMLSKNIAGVAPHFAKIADENTPEWQNIVGRGKIWFELGGLPGPLKNAVDHGNNEAKKGKRFLAEGEDDTYFSLTGDDKKKMEAGIAGAGQAVEAAYAIAATPAAAVAAAPVIEGSTAAAASMVGLLPTGSGSANPGQSGQPGSGGSGSGGNALTNMTPKAKKTLELGIAAIVIIGLAAGAYFMLKKKK